MVQIFLDITSGTRNTPLAVTKGSEVVNMEGGWWIKLQIILQSNTTHLPIFIDLYSCELSW